MIRQVIHWLAARLPLFRIQVDGVTYLDRFYIAGPEPSTGFPDGMRLRLRWLPWTVYLHRFHRSDSDRALHNHPWRAASLVLWGGYSEEYRVGEGVAFRLITPGKVHRFGPDHFHRVQLLLEGEAWTLFVVGPREGRSWGFWERGTSPDRVIPHEEYHG